MERQVLANHTPSDRDRDGKAKKGSSSLRKSKAKKSTRKDETLPKPAPTTGALGGDLDVPPKKKKKRESSVTSGRTTPPSKHTNINSNTNSVSSIPSSMHPSASSRRNSKTSSSRKSAATEGLSSSSSKKKKKSSKKKRKSLSSAKSSSSKQGDVTFPSASGNTETHHRQHKLSESSKSKKSSKKKEMAPMPEAPPNVDFYNVESFDKPFIERPSSSKMNQRASPIRHHPRNDSANRELHNYGETCDFPQDEYFDEDDPETAKSPPVPGTLVQEEDTRVQKKSLREFRTVMGVVAVVSLLAGAGAALAYALA